MIQMPKQTERPARPKVTIIPGRDMVVAHTTRRDGKREVRLEDYLRLLEVLSDLE